MQFEEGGERIARRCLHANALKARSLLSGSMQFEEGGERINDLKLILSRSAETTSLFDDDGISVRFMNSTLQGNNIRWEHASAASWVRQCCTQSPAGQMQHARACNLQHRHTSMACLVLSFLGRLRMAGQGPAFRRCWGSLQLLDGWLLTQQLPCRDSNQVQQLVGQVQFSGMTPMGTQLDQKVTLRLWGM